jgi:hypothetical protein
MAGRRVLNGRARASAASVVAALAALAAGSAAPGRVRAQEQPYQNHLVGERALGLAGAFVGVADDPSAIFHNPGGIASLDTSAVAGSLWAVVRGERHLEDGYRTTLGLAALDYSSSLSVPLFLAGVVKFGEKAEDGLRPHAIGAALFSPLHKEYRFVDQLDETGAVDRLEVRRGDSARWIGLSYGYRPRYGLSLGLSAFLASRSLTHDEVEIRARETLPAASAVGSTVTRASTLEIETRHLALRLGTLLHVTHELHAGIMVQAPGIPLGSNADAEHLDTSVGPDPTAIQIQNDANMSADLPLPWEVRMGVTILRPPDSLLTLDLSLFGPAGNADDPVQLVSDDDAQLGLFVAPSTFVRPSLRCAVGFETVVAGIVPMRGGAFFQRGSAPDLPDTSDVYMVERVGYVGAAFSIGLRTSGYDFAIGATAELGWGDALGLVRGVDPTAPPSYALSSLEETRFMVFIGGARSAVRTLVKTLLED